MRNRLGQFIEGHAKVGNVCCPKGVHNSVATEFKPGVSVSPETQFKKGFTPWNKGKTGLMVGWNKGLRGYKINRVNKKATILECVVCKKSFKPQSRLRYTAKYCSNTCHGLSNRGEKSHVWKGGTSKNYKTGYYSTKYKQWRISVFERDDYTCQGCKQVGGYLTAHHIKSFAHYPQLRFELSNGVTLCEECHKLTDNYKGKGKKS